MFNKLKKKITLENIIYIYIILNPILDIISFLYRNTFDSQFSPSTILRPIIPCILFTVLFFKENNKDKKLIIVFLYIFYSIFHIYFFKKIYNESSYGNVVNELQYIANFSILNMNLYSFYRIIKDTKKIKNAVFISTILYIISIILSILTKTSSSTYIEDIGYKGYFESGNSLCTTLILALCIILPDVNYKDWKKIIIIVISGIYLLILSGMRTGFFGFFVVIVIFSFIKIISNKKFEINKRKVLLIGILVILAIIINSIVGIKVVERRKMLKENELLNIDEETGEKRYVTGDILELYKKIKNNEIPNSYMSEAEQNALINLCEFAEKIKLSNVDLRTQQLIYNVFLVKEQKNIFLILFGNGYKNQIGELQLEMEIPALIINFGIFGFILYFIQIFIFIKSEIKKKKENSIEFVMYGLGIIIAMLLSFFSGYVLFNFSSMTMMIVLLVLYKRITVLS